MSQSGQPSSVEEVFEQIDQEATEQHVCGVEERYETFVTEELSAANARFPFMNNATYWNFLEYFSRRDKERATRAAAARYIPNLTEKDLPTSSMKWDLVCVNFSISFLFICSVLTECMNTIYSPF